MRGTCPMYRISELAKQVGLSRSTLLYYEKIGLITAQRQSNGYRSYSEKDAQRLKLFQKLQAGGLTLKECQACLEAKVERETLLQRLQALDEEIAQKQQAKDLLRSMLGLDSMRDWHQSLEREAPTAHLDWLIKQGFSEKHALRLKWLSKDMNEHEQYMADFERIFEGLDRLGPGDSNDSLRSYNSIQINAGELLEVGCGKGVTTTLLAEHSQFSITALDNDEYSLSCLRERVEQASLKNRITPVCASMINLPFAKNQFDVIWAEGSAYIMGVKEALNDWRPFIKHNGYLVISDLVWLTDAPDLEALAFWQQNYPLMTNKKQRCQMMVKAGYQIVDSFTQSTESWNNYLNPLKDKVAQLPEQEFVSNALADLRKELNIHQKYLGQYGYQIFILKNKG